MTTSSLTHEDISTTILRKLIKRLHLVTTDDKVQWTRIRNDLYTLNTLRYQFEVSATNGIWIVPLGGGTMSIFPASSVECTQLFKAAQENVTSQLDLLFRYDVESDGHEDTDTHVYNRLTLQYEK